MSLQEALLREDKVIIDTRSSEDIAERGNAVVGHINAPWTSYPYYETRFKHLSAVVPAKDTPVIVYADEQSKQTAEQFKTALEQKCGYTNVYCCVSAADMVSLNPSLEISNQANLLSTFVGQSEMRFLRESGAVLVDARDPDEIERYRDSFAGHVNIPWSTFSQYAARLKGFGGDLLGSNGLGKDSPIMVICMRGRRAMFLKEALEKQCGFTNVYNCENPGRVHPALPEVEQTNVPNTLNEHLSVDEIRSLGSGISIIDAREPEEIGEAGNAISGHINIPWSTFSQHASRLREFDDVIGRKNAPALVYCVNGRRAQSCKARLSKECGFTNVYSCASATDIKLAFPEMASTGEASILSPFADLVELRLMFQIGAFIVDVREPEEIISTSAFSGHINIPWSSFDDYLSRLSHFEELLGEKSRPIIVHCINGRRAGLFKESLEKFCGYTKVLNGENVKRISLAIPELKMCSESNAIN